MGSEVLPASHTINTAWRPPTPDFVTAYREVIEAGSSSTREFPVVGLYDAMVADSTRTKYCATTPFIRVNPGDDHRL